MSSPDPETALTAGPNEGRAFRLFSRRGHNMKDIPTTAESKKHARKGSSQDQKDMAKNTTDAESTPPSEGLWSAYITQASLYDKPMIENWRGDMSAMLIFSGLFSATLTAFIIESYKTLQSDTGTMTVALLTELSQQLSAMSNGSTMVISNSSSADFHPSTSSIVCNTLWFISLTLSLACALLATLVDQWCRDYLHKMDMLSSPVQRAKLISFLYSGLTRFGMHAMIDIIPMLLHAALFLFLAGLIAFFNDVNGLIMYILGGLLAVFLCIYLALSGLPIILLDCPYRTPLSHTFWQSLRLFQLYFPRLSHAFPSASNITRPTTITDAVIEQSFEHSDEREQRALQWTLSTLTDDMSLGPFLKALPEVVQCGRSGFLRDNDYLFWPLLESRDPRIALGRRVVMLLKSVVGNRPMEYETRSNMKHICLDALWALSMLSQPPHSNPGTFRFWFDREAIDVLDECGAVSQYSPEYELVAARAALRHCRLQQLMERVNHVESFLSQTSSLRDDSVCKRTIAEALSDIEFSDFETKVFPTAVGEALQRLKGDESEGIISHAIMQADARSINQQSYWVGARLLIACDFLESTTEGSGYRFFTTFREIFRHAKPSVAISNDLATYLTSTIFPQVDIRWSGYWHGNGIHDCDRLFSMALKFLPFIHESNFILAAHFINKFIGGRNSRAAISYIFQYCDMEVLKSCLLVNLHNGNINAECLDALWTLSSIHLDALAAPKVPHKFARLIDFLETARGITFQRLNDDALLPSSAPAMALLVQCRLWTLGTRLEQIRLALDKPQQRHRGLEIQLEEIACDIGRIDPQMVLDVPVAGNNSTEQDLSAYFQRVYEYHSHAYFRNLTEFISHCIYAPMPFKASDTIKYLSVPSNPPICDRSLQVQFSHTIEVIVYQLSTTPYPQVDIDALRENEVDERKREATHKAALRHAELAAVVRELSRLVKNQHINLDDRESRQTLEAAFDLYNEMVQDGRVEREVEEQNLAMRFSSRPYQLGSGQHPQIRIQGAW